MNHLQDPRVAIERCTGTRYPAAPFHPPERFPELARLGLPSHPDPKNEVYGAVRRALLTLGLDRARFGSPEWNPLGDVVRPGDRVLLKPNWVSEQHHGNDSWEQIITHGAVLRPLLDYVQLALGGRGTITLADGPMLNSSFEKILERTGINEVQQVFADAPGLAPLNVIDLRSVFFETRNDVVVSRRPLPGDPAGTVALDLGRDSAFFGFRGEGRYYGADYDAAEVNDHHAGDKHEYLLSASAVGADVIIDVPKLKTHAKVGITLALKGVVGVNSGRNWLPHHTQGTPATGGDQFQSSGLKQRTEYALVRAFEKASLRFPRLLPQVYRLAKTIGRPLFGASTRTIRGGGWHGNDTLWRTVLDINRALVYGDLRSGLAEMPTKRRFCLVDGIIAGEGMGPVFADPKPCGVVLAAANPVALDSVCAVLMGFDPLSIPTIARAFQIDRYKLATFGLGDIEVASSSSQWAGKLDRIAAAAPFAFQPPRGWRGHIERRTPSKVKVA